MQLATVVATLGRLTCVCNGQRAYPLGARQLQLSWGGPVPIAADRPPAWWYGRERERERERERCGWCVGLRVLPWRLPIRGDNPLPGVPYATAAFGTNCCKRKAWNRRLVFYSLGAVRSNTVNLPLGSGAISSFMSTLPHSALPSSASSHSRTHSRKSSRCAFTIALRSGGEDSNQPLGWGSRHVRPIITSLPLVMASMCQSARQITELVRAFSLQFTHARAHTLLQGPQRSL